jgi:hypothetical protein
LDNNFLVGDKVQWNLSLVNKLWKVWWSHDAFQFWKKFLKNCALGWSFIKRDLHLVVCWFDFEFWIQRKHNLKKNRKIFSSSRGLIEANKIRTQKLKEEEEKMNQKSTHNTCDTQRYCRDGKEKIEIVFKNCKQKWWKMKDVHYMDRYVISGNSGHLFWASLSSSLSHVLPSSTHYCMWAS